VSGKVVKRGARTEDAFVVRADKDGKFRDHCWFCGGELEYDLADRAAADVAFVMIEPVGEGDRIHGICHNACAARAKGSLAF
jgi:hypothetical protein